MINVPRLDEARLDNYMIRSCLKCNKFFRFLCFAYEIEPFHIKFLHDSYEIPVYLWAMVRFTKYSNFYLVFFIYMILDFDGYLSFSGNF